MKAKWHLFVTIASGYIPSDKKLYHIGHLDRCYNWSLINGRPAKVMYIFVT